MTTTITPAPTVWNEPEGIAPRGTLAVLVGRGESAAVYRRLGRRLAFDAYRVVVIDHAPEETVAALAADAVRPLVLVGSDTGALDAARLAASLDVDAVVLAGLPTSPEADSWTVEQRTACPNHQGVLATHAVQPQTLPDLGPLIGTSSSLPPVTVPGLAVHGAADQISPLDEATARYHSLGIDQVLAINDGLHDILNDVTHRTVAASIVLFLERVRLGADLPTLVHTPAGADR